MNEEGHHRLSLWPFLVGDGVLVVMAGVLVYLGPRPLTAIPAILCVGCVATGAWLGVLPFLKRYEAATTKEEWQTLHSAVVQIDRLDEVARQVGQATGYLQTMHDQAEKTVAVAGDMAQQTLGEIRKAHEAIATAEDREKALFKLEAEKLRRAEGDWLNTLTYILDHVHALHQAAMRSGQSSLITQLGNFQNACFDAARRVGLTAFVPERGQIFDPQLHKLHQSREVPPEAKIDGAMAAGYNYQGRVLRPALVRIAADEPESQESEVGLPPPPEPPDDEGAPGQAS